MPREKYKKEKNTWHDNHLVSFAYTRTCAERDRYLYFIMKSDLAYPFSEHGDSAQPRKCIPDPLSCQSTCTRLGLTCTQAVQKSFHCVCCVCSVLFVCPRSFCTLCRWQLSGLLLHALTGCHWGGLCRLGRLGGT